MAVLGAGGAAVDLRDDPAAGSRGEHGERVLVLAAEAASRRPPSGWAELELIAVGTGPGGYTGLRIGIATARGLARAHATPLTGVGTLRALAAPLREGRTLALIDARRAELFAVYEDDVEVLAPHVIPPTELPELLARIGERPLRAVGDGAIAWRGELEALGVEVPDDAAPAHHVSAAAICAIAVREPRAEPTPLYLRRPDAELALGH